MAGPTVRSSVVSSKDDANATNHTVSMPATISAGDTLFSIFGSHGGSPVAVGWPAGWTEKPESNNGANCTLSIAWKKAVGDEDGGTITVTTGASERSSHVTYCIQDAADPTVTAPEVGFATGSDASANPPNLAPAGGSKDYLFIAGFTAVYRHAHSYPADYDGNQKTFESGSLSGVSTAAATRSLSAASDNPGTMTISNLTYWIAFTAAVYPAAVAATAGRSIGAATKYGKAWFAMYRREPSGLYVAERRLTVPGVPR